MQPDFILFAQHGWADTNKSIAQLATSLATEKTLIITPNLGYLDTWLRMKPLIQQVETQAQITINQYPQTPIRIIGHSMGGLIWLEVLNRHPEWYQQIHSLILIASPIGGADLARIIDPFNLGIGIAKDLGKNRRYLAESIAKFIPTLVIAGDIDQGSDGTIPVNSTKFNYAHFMTLSGINHAALKNHPELVPIIENFWNNPFISEAKQTDFVINLIKRLQTIPGITDAHQRGFNSAQTFVTFSNGVAIKIWKNFLGVDHIFVTNEQGNLVYSGFVGWLHSRDLQQKLERTKAEFS